MRLLVLAMTGVLAGCAGMDGVFDRTAPVEYGYRPPVSPRVVARTAGVEAGRYAGTTTLISQGGACPPDTGVLTVSHGAVRYSDAANGVIDGAVGPGGRVDIRRGSTQLEGRIVANRFAGTVSGGRCAYDLALRRGGASTPSGFGMAAAVAGAASRSEAPDAAAQDADAESDAEHERQVRFAAVLARLRASRTERPVADAAAPVASEPLPSPAAGASAAPSSVSQVVTRVQGGTAEAPAQQAARLLAQGRIAAARPLYEQAAAAGDAAAATAVGKTYDPLFLANMHASEVQPDPKLAAAWYRRGVELGDPRASSRLSSLQAMQQEPGR